MPSPKPGRPVRDSTDGRPVTAALDLLGRRWSLRILWELQQGPLGFRPLQQRCDNMSSSVLRQRLAELHDALLVERRPGGSYLLTPLGQEAHRALRPLMRWSRSWAAELRRVPPLPAEDHVCRDCAMDYLATTSAAAAAAVRECPARYRAVLRGAAASVLRKRPEPGTWSILEYACHARDVFAVYHERLSRTLAEERPVLQPMRNDRRAAEEDHNGQDPEAVLADLAHRAELFAELAETVQTHQWYRTATRLPGEERSVLWIIRQAAHEGRHHLLDIRRIAARLTGAPR
ncbi:DinB family protein [Peterkaempfera sp. SMS 1(5)a]|uniref:DinB family protein n=1 Tax=Peterkaempfera podocarpi TaxID=3232308 RepID=UPI00366E43FB